MQVPGVEARRGVLGYVRYSGAPLKPGMRIGNGQVRRICVTPGTATTVRLCGSLKEQKNLPMIHLI
jgi:hypothetical protein